MTVYLQHFNEQLQTLVLYEVATCGGRLIGQVPEGAQSELERGVHDGLGRLLAHDVEELLRT